MNTDSGNSIFTVKSFSVSPDPPKIGSTVSLTGTVDSGMIVIWQKRYSCKKKVLRCGQDSISSNLLLVVYASVQQA